MNALRYLLLILAMVGGSCWILVFNYADWLRFSSPSQPDAATGQTVFIKAIRGVYYTTPEQAFWAQGILWPIGVFMALLFVIYRLIGDRPQPTMDNPRPKATALPRVVNIAWVILFLGAMFLGDHLMAIIFTGAPTLPPH